MAADQCEGFEHDRKQTKRDAFLVKMQEIVPWRALCEVIEPQPKAGIRHSSRAGRGQHAGTIQRDGAWSRFVRKKRS